MHDLITTPIAEIVAAELGLDAAMVRDQIGSPRRPDAGDLALPCFRLAQSAGCPPPQLANRLAEAINQRLAGCRAEAAGPFLNLRLDAAMVAGVLLPRLIDEPLAPLRPAADGGTVCIDFSSPNIAKHLAYHHIRSTMIGNALAHCYQAAGWTVVRINFLGDWGTAFGRLIAGWKREGLSLDDLHQAADPVGFLNALYVRISRAAEEDPAVMEEARAWSMRLEQGDEEARNLWQIFKDASLSAFRRIYDLLGVSFDSWKGEAYYEDKMQATLDELQNSGLLVEDDGALVVDLRDQGMEKPCLIRRADGGTLYATRDLCACEDRYRDYAFDRCLYVVDLGQSLHFKEWFAVARKLAKPYAESLRHIAFGVVLMWSEEDQTYVKGRTRAGGAILLADVLAEAIARAETIIAEKNPELDATTRQEVAQAVGVGAVVFNDLKCNRKNDVKFRFEDALAMQGETGPYLQYTHARLCSIERRAAQDGIDTSAADPRLLERDDEKQVLLAITALQQGLLDTIEHDEPSRLATALLHLAGVTSSWLTAGNRDAEARVIGPDPARSATRSALVQAVRQALGEGLRLLGLRAPQQM